MPGRTLTTEVLVLGKGLPADAFQPFTVFSAEHGSMRTMQRVSRKAASTQTVLDLFDEAELLLETSNQGQTWFIREGRVLTRHPGLGRDFETLRLASAFASLVAGNPVHEDSRTPVFALVRTALAAFAAGTRPDIVYFKSVYCFARDEGYPLKQQWFPDLSATDRTLAAALLNQPVANQSATTTEVSRLQTRLENYLRGHTEIILP